eukprot:scaffold218772_cov33-Tisochrysis_lutea.AAC.2
MPSSSSRWRKERKRGREDKAAGNARGAVRGRLRTHIVVGGLRAVPGVGHPDLAAWGQVGPGHYSLRRRTEREE